MTEDEYLGGLIDLTGEIGRWAVARAAQRFRQCRCVGLCCKIQEAVLALRCCSLSCTKENVDLERNAEKMQDFVRSVRARAREI